ncbi:MAG: hypothetical protein LBV08_00155 [Clostridiales bacterium]|jgi:hypothetical protein|nr:hypothetical protein [Clostridiales bacterium]
MLKRFFSLFSCLIFVIVFAMPVSAEVFLEVSTDEPYGGAKAYSDFVYKMLDGKSFVAENLGNTPSIVETNFDGQNVTIIYKDKSKINYYEGELSVIGNSSIIEINKTYMSEKFGAYTIEDYTEGPIRVDNYIKITDNEIDLNLRTSTVPEINCFASYAESQEIGLATESEKNLFQTVKGEQASIFLTSKDWSIINPKIEFNRLQFTNAQTVYLINDLNFDKVLVTECSYEISDNVFKLDPVKSYEFDKIHNTYTVNEIENPETLNYALDYIDSTNSYYLTVGDESYKITPEPFEQFKLYTSLATKSDISEGVKSIKLVSSGNNLAYLNFYENMSFDGALIDDGMEHSIHGKYRLSDGFAYLDFSRPGYFNVNEYYEDFSGKRYTAEMRFNYIDGQLFAAFVSDGFDYFGSPEDNIKYMAAISVDGGFDAKEAPKDISGPDLSLQIAGKAYSFKKGGNVYKIKFSLNNKVDLSINRDDSILEIIQGSYAIENGKIKISVDNEKYNYGAYDNYELGKQLKEGSRFMTITMLAKYDSEKRAMYFNIYDGSQPASAKRESDYAYVNNKLKSDAYCRATVVTDRETVPAGLSVAEEGDIKKAFAGTKFNIRYLAGGGLPTNNETFSFDKAGKVNINVYRPGYKQLAKGDYTIINNRININYKEKYVKDEDGLTDESTEVQNKLSFEIYKGQDSYYLKLADGIYLRTKLGQGVVTSNPERL